MNLPEKNLQLQKWIVLVAIVLFAIKIIAYFLTRSVAILTDALESTVNVVAGLIGLYSLYIASKPSDQNHPYGHGKAEFLSAAVEGTLIVVAGFVIIYKAINNFINPQPIQKLDYGILLIATTAFINLIFGILSIKQGKKNNSLALVASGRHLQSDTFSTVGIIAGLVIIYFTNLLWLDGAIAILFALIIMYTGYTILRKSVAGIMDEADTTLLEEMVMVLNKNRRQNWVDLHNLRVIKYGGRLHVDSHLTVPWYFNVNEAHVEIEELSKLIREQFSNSMELFVHSDGCQYFQCPICYKDACPVRKHPFEKRIEWTIENVLADKKHRGTD
ncbi:MAG: cation transporter [Chitinophagaceae bacterium]|nr:cation transporter [Chitinophagaceae bacterium]